ncbi:hypothetical protein H5410_056467 [Solanum commersonii]|uniref:Uncharacterized protein n=1 Tax=Solanum commersonii TaxID=4109 RepID=A0A9J5WLT0_SOLCO|nr:hypothetical protein H5410_056467 [Solanum commersonii]
MTSEIWITKRSMDNSTRKLVKRVVYQLRGSSHLENRPICPSGQNDSITKVLTNVHKKFRKNDIENLDYQKLHGL